MQPCTASPARCSAITGLVVPSSRPPATGGTLSVSGSILGSVARSRPYVDPDVPLRAAEGMFGRLLTGLPGPDDPCLTHNNYRPGNTLLGADGRIRGAIAFERSGSGLADTDFIEMSLYVWERFAVTRDAFLAGDFQIGGDFFSGNLDCLNKLLTSPLP